MSFLFPTLLTFGSLLIAAPLVIHLINLRRHRRVEWAAMEFLLQSQKRNKKWIVLKQLLLLLMRTAAIALDSWLTPSSMSPSEQIAKMLWSNGDWPGSRAPASRRL